ncbi:dehydrogenase [Actinoplanes ianthinogenes]|uniref:Dehydrogenase n=1 Tax=Actinoplanes ianthinogenes TaxID=122358 RepID=A0ABM7LUJ4_9ACTN|nr:Gfo/Idh/MocA family oxidoreductase [Actinoplanes ianthinogenes]BCJ42949.1 dehydrogenase [Actinoplanes ianthinogenes]GGQ91208.1 dehydrogenase [Actinoplanes ianthinogenes]
MGRNHARVLNALAGVELAGVLDPAPGVTAPYGVPVVRDLPGLLALGLDYAVLASPTALHEEIGLRLAEAGVHTMIEKPLAPSVPAARRLVDAFASRGLVGAVGHIERYNPALQSLRARLEAGELGEIYQIVTRRQGPFPGRIADVGVVMDLATHDIDLTAWVTGREYVQVAARTASRSGRPHEDMVSAVAGLDGGLMANHLVNWLSPFKERSTVITGERGSFVADTLTADLTFYANGAIGTEWEALRNFRGVAEGDMVRYAIPKREPLLVEHERFRDAVLGVSEDTVTLRQAMRTVEVAEAVLRSAREGGTVDVREPIGVHPHRATSPREWLTERVS